jgi:Glycosyltransferase family 87
MEVTIRHSAREFLDKRGIWNKCAWVIWLAVLMVLALRPILVSHRGTSFDTYHLAGSHWLQGENIYSSWMGFVYSPVVAAFFAPFAWIPLTFANILWRLLNSGLLLGGLAAVLKTSLFAGIKERSFGIVYILLAPLAVGNIDISQANPLVAGLLLLAIAAVNVERWNSAAFCVAIATCFKIYPIAVGLLICLIAPRRFSWRFFIALLLLLIVIPFLFQNWFYVANQYRDWVETRSSDDRRQWPIEKLPLDLWFLIHWVGHLPIPPTTYTLIQLGTAGALALFCAVQTWRGWAKKRVLIGLFSLASVWMTLCGPATESYTYLILTPAILLALVQSFDAHQPASFRALVFAAFILQLLAATRGSFLPHLKPFWALSLQPVSAVVFLVYTLLWLFKDSLWPEVHIVRSVPSLH